MLVILSRTTNPLLICRKIKFLRHLLLWHLRLCKQLVSTTNWSTLLILLNNPGSLNPFALIKKHSWLDGSVLLVSTTKWWWMKWHIKSRARKTIVKYHRKWAKHFNHRRRDQPHLSSTTWWGLSHPDIHEQTLRCEIVQNHVYFVA